ncbi:fumarylacetoacetate hydrolase family protein [Bordetella sp. BOR01]|uniref:fumarylacetoacetate hydrolase family protein n=1 Tax=Bordetella sp. BOR01 TaxID=2854779 RepID=UPI00351D2E0C
MKIGAVEVRGVVTYGEVSEGKLRPFELDGKAVSSLWCLIEAGGKVAVSAGPGLDLAHHPLLPPVAPLRKNVFCVGKNYVDHSREFAKSGFDNTTKLDLPDFPIIFTKAPSTLSAPGQAINIDTDETGSVDYEGELGVVIGRRCKRASRADAMSYVYGYTIVNDLTSRELQRRHGQWFIGKNLDGFCPVGPWVVTADEFGDLAEVRLTTRVNGEERQSARLKDMIFDVPDLIRTISTYVTLEPGDLIATGTPVGVGIGFTPPRYLKPGDTVSVSIDRIGELVNEIA